jgi:hypothetical protein
MRKAFGSSSSVKGKLLSTPPSGREWAMLQTANVGGDQMNPGIRIFPLPSANGLLGGQVRATSCPQDGKPFL